MTGNDKIPAFVLLSDEPTPDLKADGLGTRRHAEVIAGAALHTPGPFTIGVYGNWGVGKTSLLKQARSLIEQQAPEATTVWFNAWQHDHAEHPLVPLVLAIADALDSGLGPFPWVKKCQDAGRGLLDFVYPRRAVMQPRPRRRPPAGRSRRRVRKMAYILRAIGHGVKVKAPGVEIDGAKILDALDRPFFVPLRWPLPTSVYQKAFNKLEALAQRATDDAADAGPIVVFIDDLDRCQPDKAVRVLQSIRLVLGQPGFVFVLALDREPIVCYLIEEYRRLKTKDPEASGPAYLEKIVQLPLWVPSHQMRFARYIDRLLGSDVLQAHDEVRSTIVRLADVLAIGTESNPRVLVLLINRLIADEHLFAGMDFKPKNWLGFCAISRLLRQRLNDIEVYLYLVKDQGLCDELLGRGEREEEKDRALRETARKDPELLTPRESARVAIFRRVERTPSIRELLDTDLGQQWLADREGRLWIDRLIAIETPGAAAGDGIAAIEAAIREDLGLEADAPITDAHRHRVNALVLTLDPVTDDDLAYVARLPSLTTLYLTGTQVTDAGLEQLKELASLTSLDLRNTQVTDAGLEHLKGLTSLTELYLGGTKVADAGLEHLKEMTSLTALNLGGTQVTDAGLEHLKGLTSLTELYLGNTQVTDAGRKGLSDAIPGLRIL